MDNLYFFAGIGVIALVVIVVVSLILARLFKRASKDVAFIRTGFGGQKVVKDGGAVIIPILHDSMDVDMNTHKLMVSRHGADGLLAKDNIRVDVDATFYTRVKPDAEAIAMAAQTLGSRINDPAALKAVVEDKFIDVLRAAAVKMDMDELISKRDEFRQTVKEAILHNIESNGLELEDVAITRLDQTPVKYLDPNNVYDAAGLAKITQVTQEKARQRNDFEQTTKVQIEQRNLEANQQSLTIKQNDEFARLDQEREVETRRAEQEALLAKQRAERKREADVASIEAEQATTIARTNAAQAQTQAQIKTDQDLAIARQASQIAVAEKSEAQSHAQAKADEARGLAVRAAQEVITVEAVAKAEREGQVAVIAAQKEAERKAADITVRAKAEAEAADLQAAARIKLADVTERENEVRAAGERALAEAANSLSADQVQLRIRLAAIEAAPQLVAELAKPMTAVKNARVVAVTGLGANGNAVAGNGQAANVPESLTNSLLNFRTQAPLIDAIVGAAGFDLKNGLAGVAPNSLFDFDDATQDEANAEVVPAAEAEVDVDKLQKLAGIKSTDSK